MKNIIYMRVSKTDLDDGKTEQQVLDDQLPPILKKFNLKEQDCLILKEKGSAYNIDKLKNRKEFIEILRVCFDSERTTIEDIFLGNYEKEDINLYVFDSNRIMRNIEFGTFFTLLRYWFNIKLYSVNQDNLNVLDDDLIGTKMAKYMMGTVDSYLAEGYSQNISDHTKKSVREKNGITTSRDGNKWGKSLKNLDGKKASLKDTEQINKIIREMIKDFESRNVHYYFELIISRIEKEFNIRVSKAYISKIKGE